MRYIFAYYYYRADAFGVLSEFLSMYRFFRKHGSNRPDAVLLAAKEWDL